MQTGVRYLLSVPSGLQKPFLKRGETSLTSFLKVGKSFVTHGAGLYTSSSIKLLFEGRGDSALTGALPLLGLHHSATGGGLLTDLRRMACFCIKCDHRRRLDEQGKILESTCWLVVFTDAWLYEGDLLSVDSEKAIFTLAPHEIFHPTDTYVKRY